MSFASTFKTALQHVDLDALKAMAPSASDLSHAFAENAADGKMWSGVLGLIDNVKAAAQREALRKAIVSKVKFGAVCAAGGVALGAALGAGVTFAVMKTSEKRRERKLIAATAESEAETETNAETKADIEAGAEKDVEADVTADTAADSEA